MTNSTNNTTGITATSITTSTTPISTSWATYALEAPEPMSYEDWKKTYSQIWVTNKPDKEELKEGERENTMKSKIYMIPYNHYSKSYLALKEALGAIRPVNNFRFKDKLVINWGKSSETTLDSSNNLLNKFSVVYNTSNKLQFFNILKENGVNTPRYTVDVDEALSWGEDGYEVFGRHTNGYGGSDIVKFSNISEIQNEDKRFLQCQFYTQYKPKKQEYRVHVFDSKVIDVQRKALAKLDINGNPVDPKEVDWTIRNHANNFIFVRDFENAPKDVTLQAEKAFKASELDFGAFDIIYNEQEDKAYVLEVNTAPGLVGTTLEKYAKAFKDKVEELGL